MGVGARERWEQELSQGKSGEPLSLMGLLSQGKILELYSECSGECQVQGRRKTGGRKCTTASWAERRKKEGIPPPLHPHPPVAI